MLREERSLNLPGKAKLSLFAGKFMTAGAQLKLDPVQDHSQHARRRRAGKGESPGHDNRIREQTSTAVKQQSGEEQKADEVDLVAHSRAQFEGRKLSSQAAVLVEWISRAVSPSVQVAYGRGTVAE